MDDWSTVAATVGALRLNEAHSGGVLFAVVMRHLDGSLLDPNAVDQNLTAPS